MWGTGCHVVVQEKPCRRPRLAYLPLLGSARPSRACGSRVPCPFPCDGHPRGRSARVRQRGSDSATNSFTSPPPIFSMNPSHVAVRGQREGSHDLPAARLCGLHRDGTLAGDDLEARHFRAVVGEDGTVAQVGGRAARLARDTVRQHEHGGLTFLARVHPHARRALGADERPTCLPSLRGVDVRSACRAEFGRGGGVAAISRSSGGEDGGSMPSTSVPFPPPLTAAVISHRTARASQRLCAPLDIPAVRPSLHGRTRPLRWPPARAPTPRGSR